MGNSLAFLSCLGYCLVSVKYANAFFCYVSSHCPDLYKVAFCAGKQLSVRQTLLRTHLQKKQKEKECLLIWRDRTA